MAQLGANPAITVGFELIADRDHGRDQRGVVSRQWAMTEHRNRWSETGPSAGILRRWRGHGPGDDG